MHWLEGITDTEERVGESEEDEKSYFDGEA
jgi:hypothetical protein